MLLRSVRFDMGLGALLRFTCAFSDPFQFNSGMGRQIVSVRQSICSPSFTPVRSSTSLSIFLTFPVVWLCTALPFSLCRLFVCAVHPFIYLTSHAYSLSITI